MNIDFTKKKQISTYSAKKYLAQNMYFREINSLVDSLAQWRHPEFFIGGLNILLGLILGANFGFY